MKIETQASEGQAAVLETTFASDQMGSGPQPMNNGEMRWEVGRNAAASCRREFGAHVTGLEGTTKPLTTDERVLKASTMNVTVLLMLLLQYQLARKLYQLQQSIMHCFWSPFFDCLGDVIIVPSRPFLARMVKGQAKLRGPSTSP
jgi:hypothetical protein